MSRKAPTFAQLIAYIGRDADPHIGTTFARNLYHNGQDERVVAGQFLDNYRYLPKRKNGNALYHEVIVLETQAHLSKVEITQALHELAERYCEKRAPHQLAWGRVHYDTDYPHIHLMISSNAVRSPLRVRMEKSAFAKLQRDLEAFKEADFPELNGGVIYRKGMTPTRPRVTSKEGEMVRRTGSLSGKQAVIDLLKPVFDNALNPNDLKAALMRQGFELYLRGKSWGIVAQETGRRYRLHTLGLLPVFERINERNSAPSLKLQSELPAKIRPDRDTRAADLLRKRQELAAQARDLLDGFERDEEDGR